MAEWVKRHGAIVRLTHWLNAILLIGMIASGLQIYLAYPHFGPRGDSYPLPNPWAGGGIPEWARLGGWLAGGLNWHFALAWPLVITGLVYLGFLVASGSGGRCCSARGISAPRPRCSSTTSGSGGTTLRRASTTRSRRARTPGSWHSVS